MESSARGSVMETLAGARGAVWRNAPPGPARSAAASGWDQPTAIARPRHRIALNRRTSMPAAHDGRNDVEDVIDDQIGLAVEQYQVTVQKAILQAVRQRVQTGEQASGHGDPPGIGRPSAVHVACQRQ